MVVVIASTNFVVELGIVLWLLIGGQFAAPIARSGFTGVSAVGVLTRRRSAWTATPRSPRPLRVHGQLGTIALGGRAMAKSQLDPGGISRHPPATRIDSRAIATALRINCRCHACAHGASTRCKTTQDFIITACDLAHEELANGADLHWTIPDPVLVGTDEAFDAAFNAIAIRVKALAPHVVAG